MYRKTFAWLRAVGIILALTVVLTGFGLALEPGGSPAHPEIPSLAELLQGFDNGTYDLRDFRQMGLSVFTTPFNTLDGFGDGPFDPSEVDTLAFGQRPSLQGNGLLLRVNGLDAQSCNECHTIVSHATRPPTLGIGGVGGAVNNAIIMPDLIDTVDDPQFGFDGTAEFTGRFANPPFLFGGGGVEMLAKEMTANLQALLAQARQAPAGTVIQLDTHGTHFGEVTSLGNGDVDLAAEGLGPEDTHGVAEEEVLVVRPFGRKGENFSMRDFDRGAMQFHFGIQPVEVVGADIDGDGDGLTNEITIAEMSMLHIFDVTNPVPVRASQGGAGQGGETLFHSTGCASCHHPEKATNSRHLPLATPEVATDPSQNVYFEIDLKKVGFRQAPNGGVRVPLFSDLKRHKMGPRLAESFTGGEIANDEFITARLWGIADTAPYLHDGRATTLYQAIEFHGGEAQAVRDQFLNLSAQQQQELIDFLKTLRAPDRPNEDLID